MWKLLFRREREMLVAQSASESIISEVNFPLQSIRMHFIDVF